MKKSKLKTTTYEIGKEWKLDKVNKKKIITLRITNVEEECIKKIQEHMQNIIGKGVKISQSDVIRNCINEYYYQNITK